MRFAQITMPLLVIKLYRLIHKENWFGLNNPSIFPSVEVAAITSIVMVILGAIVRLGCDELWNTRS